MALADDNTPYDLLDDLLEELMDLNEAILKDPNNQELLTKERELKAKIFHVEW